MGPTGKRNARNPCLVPSLFYSPQSSIIITLSALHSFVVCTVTEPRLFFFFFFKYSGSARPIQITHCRARSNKARRLTLSLLFEKSTKPLLKIETKIAALTSLFTLSLSCLCIFFSSPVLFICVCLSVWFSQSPFLFLRKEKPPKTFKDSKATASSSSSCSSKKKNIRCFFKG